MKHGTRRTSVGLGLPNGGKRYVGQFYVNTGQRARSAYRIHSSALCSEKAATEGYKRLPVYEDEEGGYFWYQAAHDSAGIARICEDCPAPMPRDWMEDGACFGTTDEGFHALGRRLGGEQRRVIEEFCSVCPVVVDCLEYGANSHHANSGSIWGGTYFPFNEEQRLQAIADRRLELSGASSQTPEPERTSSENN